MKQYETDFIDANRKEQSADVIDLNDQKKLKELVSMLQKDLQSVKRELANLRSELQNEMQSIKYKYGQQNKNRY